MPEINLYVPEILGALGPVIQWLIAIITVLLIVGVLTRRMNKRLTGIILLIAIVACTYWVFTR